LQFKDAPVSHLLISNLEALRKKLKSDHRIAVLTGAGVSAESGIPTFRGSGGLWKQYRAEDLATPEAFSRDPKLVWEWYDWRRGLIAGAQPNAGHIALAELESRSPNFTLITQNVDDLHERAGSKNVLHVHGSIWKLCCLDCRRESVDMRSPLPEIPPRCECGGLLRPAVVWFGESLPPDVWEQAEKAARLADILLVVGTSALVYPAAGLIHYAKEVIEVNIQASGVTESCLEGPSGELLPQLIA
jgi:NAD-dependent deacetylase